MAASDFADRILRFVGAKGYVPQSVAEIATGLGIAEQEQGDFHDACKALRKTGRVVIGSRGGVMLPPPPPRLLGRFRANLRGFGFVIPEEPNSHGDLYVPRGATGGATTGDRVVAAVKKKGRRRGTMLYEGRILEILERGRNRFVGELRNDFGKLLVLPDGQTFHAPVFVADGGAKQAKPGHKVVVEVAQFPGPGVPARGAIVKVLGKAGRTDVEIRGIIEQYQLPDRFSLRAQAQARRLARAYDPDHEIATREDLRKETILTIDPPDARDFDDAISIRRLPGGQMQLGVHIADVAHFVPEGGALDEEAKRRCTSVYFPRTVIPMLPEALSNGVCSLLEHETRLTKSVFIIYDRAANVVETRLANTVIKSRKRLTYDQVDRILEGKPGGTGSKIVALLGEMQALAKRILQRRLLNGMLRLDLPEAELVFDEKGRAVDVAPVDTGFSHTIIEMFMVEANEAVSRTLTDSNVWHLRRIHDAPSELADAGLRKFLGALGYELKPPVDRFVLQKLLDAVRGKPAAFPVHLAVLRSMRQAEYSPLRVGHFALAGEHYCHFTSPIRRYPDLTVHRLVDRYVKGEFNRRRRGSDVASAEELAPLGSLCSSNERRAEMAERELRTILTLQLLGRRLGDKLDGTVTGAANVGVFVQLDGYLVDGLVRFDSLPDDWWEVDSAAGLVCGERSGMRIAVGDRVEVTISRVNVRTRQLDLSLIVSSARRRSSRPRKHK